VDLDNINGHGLSFYDDTALNIKTEKDMENVSYNCSMHNIEPPYPMYTQHIKEEEEEDIGLSVIRHLKEEITNTCKILRINKHFNEKLSNIQTCYLIQTKNVKYYSKDRLQYLN
jgi:hypothetical protein